MRKFYRSVPFRILRVLLLAYCGIVGIMLIAQRSYIYYPETAETAALERAARSEGVEPWLDADGQRIGWRAAQETGSGQLVIFHGNAGHALHRTYYVDRFRRLGEQGFAEILIFEYPGYADRGGRPSEDSFLEAATAAINELAQENTDGAPLFLLGESLGSGVACHLAASHPEVISGLLLVTPFTRLSDVGRAHFPFLPVRILLRDHYPNETNLEAYSGPVSIIIAEHDRVVPARLGRRLYESYPGPKHLYEAKGADHNNLFHRSSPDAWETAVNFVVSSAILSSHRERQTLRHLRQP